MVAVWDSFRVASDCLRVAADWLRNGWLWLDDHGNAVMALVTTVYGFFTILLWRVTRRQADAAAEQARLTREQADLTRTIFEATHRPEVSVDPIFRESANPGYVPLRFKLTNHGRMTAVITQWSASLTRNNQTIAQADQLAGSLVVFPDASSDAPPSIDVKGAYAAVLWWSESPDHGAILEVSVSYRGAGPSVYTTKMRAAFWATGDRPVLKQVQHEIT